MTITKTQIKDFQKKLVETKKLAIEFHRKCGEIFGYPDCCIEQFCTEAFLGIPSAQFRLSKWNMPIQILEGIDYIPCDKCMAKIIEQKIPY
jgi:hypothetical protein